MIQKSRGVETTWESLREELVRYHPDDVSEYDGLKAAGDHRAAVSFLQARGIVSPNAWIFF